jgi:hypothetical protein
MTRIYPSGWKGCSRKISLMAYSGVRVGRQRLAARRSRLPARDLAVLEGSLPCPRHPGTLLLESALPSDPGHSRCAEERHCQLPAGARRLQPASLDRASRHRTQMTLTWVFSRSNLALVQHGPHYHYRRHLLRSFAPSYSAFLEAYKACRGALDFGGHVHSLPFPHVRYSAGEDVTLAEKLSTRVKYTSPGYVGTGAAENAGHGRSL